MKYLSKNNDIGIEIKDTHITLRNKYDLLGGDASMPILSSSTLTPIGKAMKKMSHHRQTYETK